MKFFIIFLGLYLLLYFVIPLSQKTTIGFPFDDSWIHLQYSKNVLLHHQLGLNPGHWSAGTTSYLWVVLIIIFSLFNVHWLPSSSLFIGCISYIVFLLLFYDILKTLTKSTFISFFGTVILSFSPLLIMWSLSGMEVTFFLFLSVLTLYFISEQKFESSAVVISFLIFLRPESILMYPLLLLVKVLKKQNVKRIFSGFCWLPLVSLFLLFLLNYLLGGSILNTTFSGRRLLWVGPDVPLDFSRFPAFVQSQFDFYRDIFTVYPFDQFSNLPLPIIITQIFLGVLFILGGILLIVKIWRNKGKNIFLPLFICWLIIHNVFYIYFLPTRGHLGRYQPENLLFLYFLSFLVVQFFFQKKYKISKVISVVILIEMLMINILALPFWQKMYILSVQHINTIHVQIGKDIDQNAPKNATIAAYDIGALSYFANRNIVDISCLTDKKCIERVEQHKLVFYIKENNAEYLAMPEFSTSNAFIKNLYQELDAQGVERMLIKTYDFGTWEDNFVTWNAVPRIGLYKLEYKH